MMYDNNMTSNKHLSHVLFQLFSVSLFSLACFVKHFDGEIVLAPRSYLRSNFSHGIRARWSCNKSCKVELLFRAYFQFMWVFFIAGFYNNFMDSKVIPLLSPFNYLNGSQRCVHISSGNVSMMFPLVLWENHSPVKRWMLGLMKMIESMELCV